MQQENGPKGRQSIVLIYIDNKLHGELVQFDSNPTKKGAIHKAWDIKINGQELGRKLGLPSAKAFVSTHLGIPEGKRPKTKKAAEELANHGPPPPPAEPATPQELIQISMRTEPLGLVYVALQDGSVLHLTNARTKLATYDGVHWLHIICPSNDLDMRLKHDAIKTYLFEPLK